MSTQHTCQLLWPTPACTPECSGLCGYCPEHEKASRDPCGDWIIAPKDPHGRPVYISTARSTYPQIRGFKNGLQYGRGTMKTSVQFGVPFMHDNAGMSLCAIAGTGTVFGVSEGAYVLTVGGRCWRY